MTNFLSNLSRRKFLVTASTTTAAAIALNACSSGNSTSGSSPAAGGASPAASPAAALPKPEVTTAKLGFIALTDSAPLIIAKEKGIFAKYGMPDVEVTKQASWGAVRDNMELGSAGNGIDGAHILTPMPYLMTLGKITKAPLPMTILARLNTNGQGISVSNDFKDAKIGVKSTGLKEAFASKSAGKEPQCAVTFPGGTHDLWMRYWLAANGIDPETDVSIIVVPPPQMVASMKTNSMLAFCVGEPWNAQLISQKLGSTALVTGELWQDHPEKSLAMRADWVEKNPNAALAITAAVIEAQQWCEQDANKDEMCKIIGERKWLKVEPADIVERAKGNIEYGDGKPALSGSDLKMKFWADNASFPYKSHDIWFMTENIRWGKIPADTDVKALVDKVNKSDIWREAAKAVGVPAAEIPTSDSRGVEKFFDGVEFDPENPKKYLDSLKIKKA